MLITYRKRKRTKSIVDIRVIKGNFLYFTKSKPHVMQELKLIGSNR